MFYLWVCVLYGFYVGLAKLHRSATPPSVISLYSFARFANQQQQCSGEGGEWPLPDIHGHCGLHLPQLQKYTSFKAISQ